MDLLHRRHHVVQVFDDVVRLYFRELIVSERPRADVQVMDDVRVRRRHDVDVDRFRVVFLSRTEVEHGAPVYRGVRARRRNVGHEET